MLVNNSADAADLDAIADELNALADKLALTARSSRYSGTAGLAAGADATNAAVLETHTVIGRSNPIAPPMTIDERGRGSDAEHDERRRVRRLGHVVTARVTYGHQYEGPPGCVHGGMLATAFDIVLAMSAAACGQLLVTGTLTVRYRRPTPLHAELRFEGRLAGVDGRKVRSTATVTNADGDVTAEAEGIFLIVGDDRYRVE
jgi:acyl-coenzyme A thioesterase PaaI-like protein